MADGVQIFNDNGLMLLLQQDEQGRARLTVAIKSKAGASVAVQLTSGQSGQLVSSLVGRAADFITGALATGKAIREARKR